MSEPLERIRKTRPQVEIDPLTIAKAKVSLMNEIANEKAVGKSVKNTENADADRPHPQRRSEVKRHRSILAVAAVLAIVTAGIGAYSILDRDDGFEVANDETPNGEVEGREEISDAEPEKSSEPVTNFDSSTFKFDVDEIIVSIDDGEEYRPVGDVYIYNSLELGDYASGGSGISANEDTFESVNGYPDPHPNPYVDFDRHRVEVLELSWGGLTSEIESAQTKYLSFGYASDETHWWIYDVEVYGGTIPSRMFAHGEFFKSPLDTAFDGDITIDVRSRDDSDMPDLTGKITLTGATLEAFRTPTECLDPQGPFALTHSDGPIELEVVPSGISGGTVSVGLVDTKTCTNASPDEYTISRAVDDDEIVRVFAQERDGGASFRVSAIRSGQTTLRFEATENTTGNVVASTEISVTASTPAETIAECDRAQRESNRYLLTPYISTSLNVGDTVPYLSEVQLWDTETCQPEALSNYTVEVLSGDSDVVEVTSGIEPGAPFDEAFYADTGSISFTMAPINAGNTTITVRVTDNETGDIVAELDTAIETI